MEKTIRTLEALQELRAASNDTETEPTPTNTNNFEDVYLPAPTLPVDERDKNKLSSHHKTFRGR